jgi:ribonuclease VapC
MSARVQGFVLDSWAVLAFFQDEPGGAAVQELIAEAQRKEMPLLMSVVNGGEVYYIITRGVSQHEADNAIASLLRMGVEFVDAGWDLARMAGEIKAKYALSYADCFAAALARNVRAVLVTGDREFEQVETLVRIRWLDES